MDSEILPTHVILFRKVSLGHSTCSANRKRQQLYWMFLDDTDVLAHKILWGN